MRRAVGAVLAILVLIGGLSPPLSAQLLGPIQGITVIDSGTACVTAPTACATFDVGTSASFAFDVSGTWTGTLTFEATTNGGTWRSIQATNPATGAVATTTTASGTFTIANAGFVQIRIRATATITGTAQVSGTRGYARGSGLGTVNPSAPITLDTTSGTAFRRLMTTPSAPSLVTDQSGVNLAAGDYKVAIVGVDPLGGTSLPSPIVTQTVGAGGTGEILVTFTTGGADHVLVYISPVNGSTPDRYFPCNSITNGVTLTNCNITTLAGATVAALPVTNTAYETSLGSSPSWVYGMTFWSDALANTAFGRLVFGSSVTGVGNVGVGWKALPVLTTGNFNTAVGTDALYHNTIGNGNTGMGNDNSFQLTTGGNNTSYGMDALYNNTVNHKNTAVGVAALYNVDASFNTAIGYNALYSSTAGASNVALGYSAGYYETGSNKLFVDNVTRTNESDGRAKALLYGIFDAAVANQSLTVNGDVLVPGSTVRVGATPALTGLLRVSNNSGGLRARNAANSGDITLVDINGSNGVVVGNGATTIGLATGNTGFGIETTAGMSWNLNSSGHLMAVTDNVSDIGAAAATRPRTGNFGTSVVAPTVNGKTAYQINGVLAMSATAPTVTTAGTSPTVPNANGTQSFRVNVGTGGTATTIVLALPTATTGWNCWATNLTAAAANRADGAMVQQSSSTTAATIQYQTVSTGAAKAFTASDIVTGTCDGF